MSATTFIFRVGVAIASFVCVGPLQSAENSDPLGQGWTSDQIARWYETSQGSRLIPLAWLQALEQPESTAPFLADEHIRHFRYVPRDLALTKTTSGQKIRLPRGFAIDVSNDSKYAPDQTKLRWKQNQTETEPWVGMTCAACHTTDISYRGQTWTILGAPALADFQSFIRRLDKAMAQTLSDKEKFSRFSAGVLLKANSPVNQAFLRTSLQTRVDWTRKLAQLNETDSTYGFGRLDAVGNILNKVALITGASNPLTNPSDAPVSYPFLWNVPQHDKVQWNGMAANKEIPKGGLDVGALGRNTGEVVGVFADVQVVSHPGLSGYVSSVHVSNLSFLERMLKTLKPPAMPATLRDYTDENGVRISEEQRQTFIRDGSKLYDKHCASCHAKLPREDLKTHFEASMSRLKPENASEPPIGTDPWMACNAFTFSSYTGKMEGTKVLGMDPIGESERLSDMLPTVIAEVLLGKKASVLGSLAGGFLRIPPSSSVPPAIAVAGEALSKAERKALCLGTSNSVLAYKARPLSGIWATAPYLHNGSVSSLAELLLPPAKRKMSFQTGSKEFDVKSVGFVSEASPDNGFTLDTSIEGNSKEGHDYGAGAFTPRDRRVLLEFLKTL